MATAEDVAPGGEQANKGICKRDDDVQNTARTLWCVQFTLNQKAVWARWLREFHRSRLGRRWTWMCRLYSMCFCWPPVMIKHTEERIWNLETSFFPVWTVWLNLSKISGSTCTHFRRTVILSSCSSALTTLIICLHWNSKYYYSILLGSFSIRRWW